MLHHNILEYIAYTSMFCLTLSTVSWWFVLWYNFALASWYDEYDHLVCERQLCFGDFVCDLDFHCTSPCLVLSLIFILRFVMQKEQVLHLIRCKLLDMVSNWFFLDHTSLRIRVHTDIFGACPLFLTWLLILRFIWDGLRSYQRPDFSSRIYNRVFTLLTLNVKSSPRRPILLR